MPTTLLPPSIEAALVAKPIQPRLVSWYEWPLRMGGFALPVAVFGACAAAWLSRGPMVAMLIVVGHLALLAVTLNVLPVHAPKKILAKMIAQHGKWQRVGEWLAADWSHPPLAAAVASGPIWVYCGIVESFLAPWLKLMHLAPLAYPKWEASEGYVVVVGLAAIVGFMRTGAYNRDFRDRFQAFKRALSDLDGYRRRRIWEAVSALPRADFDGHRSRRGEPTPTASRLCGALQARGFRQADVPGGENDGPRLILEYELVGLRRGPFNYRADLALVMPGKNVKLDIELDGGYHHTLMQRLKDARRNSVFLDRGWAVIRFDNSEVERDLAGCVREVERVLAIMQQAPRLDFEGTNVG
jgi:hypothetical protein